MTLDKKQHTASVGLAGCVGLLSLLLVSLVTPLSSGQAYANEGMADEENTNEEGDPDGAAVPSTQALTDSTLNIAFSPENASGSVTPVDANGDKAKVDVQATVTVQNSGGYSVYVGSTSSQLTDGKGNAIDSVTSATTYANLPLNRWGYSFRKASSSTDKAVTDSYVAMPATVRSTALDSNNATNIKSDTRYYMLSFAANIGADKPAGTYTNSVTMSVVSSPLEISNAFGIEYMQDMTATVCSGVSEGTTGQLIDKRDNKKYWVTKMKDGNCWMTQNLDLDIPSGGFTSNSTAAGTTNSYALSDMGATTNGTTGITTGGVAWNNPTAATVKNTFASFSSSVYTESRSWDQELYVYTNPDSGTNCNGSASGTQGLGYSNCSSTFTKVDDSWTASDQADFATTNGSPINTNTKTYDAHYLVGNWYQWNAAVAGTGGTIKSTAATEAGMVNATSSICPAGWRLPTSGGTDTNKPFNQAKSFGALLKAYGGNGTSSVAQNNIQTNTLTKSPYFFVRSGNVDNGGYLTNSGYVAYYWSSTAYTSTSNAYNLNFNTGTNVYPSNSDSRYYGFSVRCVAR